MVDEQNNSRFLIAREVRQRLENLRRAGLEDLPIEIVIRAAPPAPKVRPASNPAREVEESYRAATPAVVATTPPPKVIAVAPIIPQSAAKSLFDSAGMTEPAVSAEERPARLDALASEVAGCTQCPALVISRTRTVFGTGSPTARLMFVGEAPGADEDRAGLPFVGRSGMLLTDMITKGMGLTREEVYIANVIKSRPPENRTPLPDEVAHCLPFLERQIAIIRPEFLCLLGKVAASALLNTAMPLGKLRGRWHRYREIPTVVTWHPSYLLRLPSAKKEAWEDLQMLMKAMGLTPPARKARE